MLAAGWSSAVMARNASSNEVVVPPGRRGRACGRPGPGRSGWRPWGAGGYALIAEAVHSSLRPGAVGGKGPGRDANAYPAGAGVGAGECGLPSEPPLGLFEEVRVLGFLPLPHGRVA